MIPTSTAIALGLNSREIACDGKKRIRTPEYAENFVAFLAKKYGSKQGYYHCPWCLCYHLYTHKETTDAR